MSLKNVQPENKTEQLFLPITKNCGRLVKQTYTKSQETLEFKITKSRETFLLKPSIKLGLDSNWMVGLTPV